MKKLLIAATLAAATLGATSLFADPGHQHGQKGAQGTETERHADMQKRMQENHARMAQNEEGSRHGRGRQEREHQH